MKATKASSRIGIDRAGAGQFQPLADHGGKARHDAGENDQRDAIADAAAGDLFADPHQEDGAAGQRDHRGQAEEKAGIDHGMAPMFQAHRDAIGLHHGQADRAVTGILVEDLAARLTLFLQGFQFRKHRRHQLDDDRGRDVRHDSEGEDRHAIDRAARQCVEHIEQAAALLLQLLGDGRRVDAGHWDIGAQAGDNQRAQREKDAVAQFMGFAQIAEIEIRRPVVRLQMPFWTPPAGECPAPLFI